MKLDSTANERPDVCSSQVPRGRHLFSEVRELQVSCWDRGLRKHQVVVKLWVEGRMQMRAKNEAAVVISQVHDDQPRHEWQSQQLFDG